MDKMRLESIDMTAANVEKIGELFPSVITEALDEEKSTPEKKVYKKAINFAMLRQLLSEDIIEGDECYEFTWVGKKAAMVEANRPIRKTLRPCVEESKKWETTENLYIEGDNLEVLKLLQESYLGKVKMIYIDPPYNTGNDFLYRDDFKMSQEEYDAGSGVYDEDDNRMFHNAGSNGRFHSDWCSMMYPRLQLARNLLTDEGFIFISIDDNEVANLRKICDEVFGENNLVGIILWKKKTNGNNMGLIPPVHDYIVVYSKRLNNISDMGYEITKEFIEKTYSNPDNDPRGPWTTMDLSANHKGPYFPIVNPLTSQEYLPPEGRYWVFNEPEVKKRIADGRIIFGKSGTARPVQKVFALERSYGKIRAESWWDNHGMNEDATAEIKELLGQAKLFVHPKPKKLLYHLIKISGTNDDIILDFFSGSATTAHAVMQLNAEDSGKRKFIMVQLLEKTDVNSEAYKAGFNNISEIGKERIRRAGEKIKEEAGLMAQNLDTGFRVFKLDSTNMKDVYYAAGEYRQEQLEMFTSNIKEDRTDLDLLYGCLLEWGLPLSLPHKMEQIGDVTVHTVNDGDLIACFADKIDERIIREIAKRRPLRAVFRDSSFADSPDKINVGEIFKLLAPNTRVKVI